MTVARRPIEPTGLPLVDGLPALERPTIENYCLASAECIREATALGPKKAKAAQIRLSNALGAVTLADLRAQGITLPEAFAGEREVGGGLRSVRADVSEMTTRDGLTLAIEIKPVHLAVGRAIWNRFGDVRTFAVNLHLKFPFAVVGGILTLPTTERIKSGNDDDWKSTTHLVTRAIGRFMRAGGRATEGDASHLMEGIAVVAFDRETGNIEPDLPPPGSGLRWEEFIAAMAEVYDARFGDI
jgi:hypothetical protein